MPSIVHVVEDDPAVADSLRLLLKQMGHAVRVHADGASFLAMGAAPGDVLLLDLALPDIGGAEILRRVRSTEADVRCIIMTGLPRVVIEREIVDLDDVVVLRKPIPTADLVRLLSPDAGGPM